MRTGKLVQDKWLYASDCCLREILFDSGDSFSRCPQCSNLCGWEMVDVTTEQMKYLNRKTRYAKDLAKRSNSGKLELRPSY